MRLEIEVIDQKVSVCKLPDLSQVPFEDAFCFLGKTDGEQSLVCATEHVPENALEEVSGWRMFRIKGTLDFSLIGILANISAVLAERKIGLFVVSTYDTDYILVKQEQLQDALDALAAVGHQIYVL
jgi:hypothetical protein